MRHELLQVASEYDLEAILSGLSLRELEALASGWRFWARSDQLPPPHDWLTWLVLGGRGSGKTRTGAEWVRGLALGLPGFAAKPVQRIALVGESVEDVRAVMIEGESGILAVHDDDERPYFEASKRQLVWPTGCIAQSFSGSKPDGLRGPQFEAAWCDELAKWQYPRETWDMLQFALRLGDRPRQLVTTTPRPIALLKHLIENEKTALSRSKTSDNRDFLAPQFVEHIEEMYGGSRLGRQELEAEILSEREDALWKRSEVDALRVNLAPDLKRVVVAVDPPATSTANADACGIVIAGLSELKQCFVLGDRSIERASPLKWARAAVAAYRLFEADSIVAEVNQGGEMVTTLIHQVDSNIPVKSVRASRGKYTRAEPVAALYEQGRVRHVGSLPLLEDELFDFGPGGLSSGKSPDRLDALVWAVSELVLDRVCPPKIRQL